MAIRSSYYEFVFVLPMSVCVVFTALVYRISLYLKKGNLIPLSLQNLIYEATLYYYFMIFSFGPFAVFFITLFSFSFNEVLFCIMSFSFSFAGGLACCTLFIFPIIKKRRLMNYFLGSQVENNESTGRIESSTFICQDSEYIRRTQPFRPTSTDYNRPTQEYKGRSTDLLQPLRESEITDTLK